MAYINPNLVKTIFLSIPVSGTPDTLGFTREEYFNKTGIDILDLPFDENGITPNAILYVVIANQFTFSGVTYKPGIYPVEPIYDVANEEWMYVWNKVQGMIEGSTALQMLFGVRVDRGDGTISFADEI